MINLSVSFDNPWCLLLLLLAVIVTVFPYFRMSKKYRCTRNRISSMTLHMIIMLLSILVLAGTVFSYNVKNYENEVIVLVDLSDSNIENKSLKDNFVKNVIDNCDDSFKLGIVTFGYDQVYASPLSHDKEKSYVQYLNAALPNVTATNIESALNYAKELFTHPETAKIVLISDGIETDGDAINVISAMTLEGIKVDTVYFGNDAPLSEVQIIDVVLPDYNVVIGDKCSINLTLQSAYEGDATINIYDNDKPISSSDITLKEGKFEVILQHTFDLPGLHRLSFEVVSGEDTLLQNNVYHSYLNLAVYDKILLIEYNGEGQYLKDIISEHFDVELIKISEVKEKGLLEVDNLRQYDQVVMLNVSNHDIQNKASGFDSTLNEYVHKYGGGLLTAGGNNDGDLSGDKKFNMYSREDLLGSLYQNMLPVQAINYTPPLGIVLVIDRSGSMSGDSGNNGLTCLEAAKEGAIAALEELTERDYCGMIALETEYTVDCNIVSATEKYRLQESIKKLEIGGGTNYEGALTRAAQALMSIDVQRRHIILISDGQPGDPDFAITAAEAIAKKDITISTFTVGDSVTKIMKQIAEIGQGTREEPGAYCMNSDTSISANIGEDLSVPAIEEVVYEEFQPEFGSYSQVQAGITEEDLPTLDGFYGVKPKSSSVTALYGPYVPIYSYWNYGKGSVGSFMCDLSGYWSSNFLNDETGKLFIRNVIFSLFPVEDIRPNDINVTITQDNYSNTASIFTPLKDGEKIRLEITAPEVDVNTGEQVRIIEGNSSNGFSRISFSIQQSGIHHIKVIKLNATDEIVGSYETEQSFSYSQEYNAFLNEEVDVTIMEDFADAGDGKLVTTSNEIFDGFVMDYNKTFDPRILFMIIAIILFLLDVAVRKFKFKWPHEIFKDMRAKKTSLKK